jgi:hypothetical protein
MKLVAFNFPGFSQVFSSQRVSLLAWSPFRFSAYAELAEAGDVALAFCWSHVRRQFYEIQAATPAVCTENLVRFERQHPWR